MIHMLRYLLFPIYTEVEAGTFQKPLSVEPGFISMDMDSQNVSLKCYWFQLKMV